jgi:hypothetical protein
MNLPQNMPMIPQVQTPHLPQGGMTMLPNQSPGVSVSFGCMGCPEGPGLRDVAPKPTLPTWAKILGVMLGITALLFVMAGTMKR